VKCDGIALESVFVFPDEAHRIDFQNVIGNDPWWRSSPKILCCIFRNATRKLVTKDSECHRVTNEKNERARSASML